MSFEGKKRQKKFDYTNDKENKGKAPLFREMKGKDISRLLLQTMHELKREIKGMKRERHEGPSRRFSNEGTPIIHTMCANTQLHNQICNVILCPDSLQDRWREKIHQRRRL